MKSIKKSVLLILINLLNIPVFAEQIYSNFDVAKHGFSFRNSNWKNICYNLDNYFQLRYDPHGFFCNAEWGLCGGMSLIAGDRYLSGLTSSEQTQEAMKPEIVDAQFRTLTAGTVKKFFNWIASPDQENSWDPNRSVGYRMRGEWNKYIHPYLEAGKPVVLGLVFDKKMELIDLQQVGALFVLSEQHQVLATGFSQYDDDVKVYAYDPNFPGETLIMEAVLGKTGVNQRLESGNILTSDRKAIRGFFFICECEGRL